MPTLLQTYKKRAARFLYTEQVDLTAEEMERRFKLLAVIQGNAMPGKHDKDVFHLFEAAKYGGGYFVHQGHAPAKESQGRRKTVAFFAHRVPFRVR